MRLREMKYILDEKINELTINSDQYGSGYKINNILQLSEAIKKINTFGFINQEFYLIEIFLTNNRDSIILNYENLKSLQDNMETIKLKSLAVTKAIEVAIPKQDSKTISIKLPKCETLIEVSSFTKDIENIFNQCLFGEYRSTICLQNFDTGSNWIEVVLANAKSIAIIGALVKAATDYITNSYMRYQQTKLHIESLQLDNEKDKQTIEARNLLLEKMREDLKIDSHLKARKIMNDFNISELEEEYHSKLSISIERLGKLIADGTEIHPALSAPAEEKGHFPNNDEETRKLLNIATKLLTTELETKDKE